MNGRALLEGLGHIDERFIEEAEHQRLRKFPVWIALAACLCLVIFGAYRMSNPSANETVNDGALGTLEHLGPAETQMADTVDALLQGVQYVQAGWDAAGEYPHTALITSREGLSEYTADHKLLSDNPYGRYDDAYFAEHDLLLLVLEASSGSIRHQVLAVRQVEAQWVIDLQTIVPEVCTTDMAQWHILVEVPRGVIRPEDQIIISPVK